MHGEMERFKFFYLIYFNYKDEIQVSRSGQAQKYP